MTEMQNHFFFMPLYSITSKKQYKKPLFGNESAEAMPAQVKYQRGLKDMGYIGEQGRSMMYA